MGMTPAIRRKMTEGYMMAKAGERYVSGRYLCQEGNAFLEITRFRHRLARAGKLELEFNVRTRLACVDSL